MRGIIGASLALPYARRVRWFGAFVDRVVSPVSGYRKRARDQVAMIWPDLPAAEVERIARGCCNNFGRTMIEAYSRDQFAAHLQNARVHGAGLAPLAQAKTDGRPVLFVSGHFGNHEAPRHALNRMGYKIGGIYKPISNPYFNTHYLTTIENVSGPVFPVDRDGMAGFMKWMQEGGMGTMLFDVRLARYPKIPFLGRPAHTSPGLAAIAQKANALILPYFATRRADGLNFDIEVEAPVTQTTHDEIMREVTDRLEAKIKAHPEQYFWVHRRWG